MAALKEVNGSNFKEEVTASNIPVLVDFWAPWCGPCRMMSKVLEELASDYEGRLKVVKVNVDENSDLAGQFGVMSIPTLKLFKSGAEVDSMVGAHQKQALAANIDRHI